ncbi:MAG: hypothetical protein ACTSUI_04450, partial [Promethearchaeota archaeon]
MGEIIITRYNPRLDKESLIDLIQNFEYRAGKLDLNAFSQELEKRLKDLKMRNSIIVAKDDSTIVGAGFFTVWYDFLGRINCVVHDVAVRKEDAFKRGIEEKILRELFGYLKKTMKIESVQLIAHHQGDSNLQSIFMKLG